MKILFIGAVSLSASLLNELILMKQNIVGVFTIAESKFNSDHVNLKPIAEKANIPVFLTKNINGQKEVNTIKKLKPDVIFCFGWSSILKKQILLIPQIGTIGYHPAALPANRGRHPIIWALVLGLNKTASTFFFIDKGIDSGEIIDQKVVMISPNDDANSLYEKIREISLLQIKEIIPKLKKGDLIKIPQNSQLSNSWRKRDYQDGLIDWRMSAESIHNLIRGLTKPYFGAEFRHKKKSYKT